MKFNELFRNKRNIYFTVLIVFTLLLAGSLWQFRNIALENAERAQLEKYQNIDEMELNAKAIEKNNETNSNEPQITEVTNTGEKSTKITEAKDTVVPNKKPDNAANADSTAKAKETPKAIPAIKIEEPKLDTMVLPVFGTVSTDFANEKLVYSKTLDLWTTHEGLDIKSEEGSPVRAAMDGTVCELKNDPQLGLTIVLDHNGAYTKYSNLSTLDLVSLGQKVKKGDVISGVGKTALYEIADDPHLHFEVIKSDKSIDPKQYMPKQSLKQ